jgi:hypothetical protein
MPKIALYTAAAVFALLAALQSLLYLLEVDAFIGGSLYRPMHFLMAAILFTLLVVWMIVASLDIRSDQ